MRSEAKRSYPHSASMVKAESHEGKRAQGPFRSKALRRLAYEGTHPAQIEWASCRKIAPRA